MFSRRQEAKVLAEVKDSENLRINLMKKQMRYPEFVVKPEEKFSLKNYDPNDTGEFENETRKLEK